MPLSLDLLVLPVEFGLCRQDDGVKAFGTGLLSSFGELNIA
jgi:phenylalanine-4-hydroxylase